MIKIHPIQTGLVRIRMSQRNRKLGGALRILFDREWTEWLPIFAWAIEHPEGIIIVDAGETARVTEPGYLPPWHPFFRLAAGFDVKPADEIGPQLRKVGISPEDVRTVIITHLHTDHAGGLHHFPRSRIYVADGEYKNALGLWGKLNGYLPHRWPMWFAPVPIPFTPTAFGGFARSFPVTVAGDVVVVPTPGHTPNHVSVIVKTGGFDYFLAGDTSYTERQLLERRSDGVSMKPKVTIATINRICDYLSSTPTVYLPTHDPDSTVNFCWFLHNSSEDGKCENIMSISPSPMVILSIKASTILRLS
jgi:glyoxylase-like metal-dependent hydrolase (beta-lactamase superfamily II)